MLCPPHRRHQQVKTFGVLARVTFDAEKSQALSKLNAEKMDVVRGAWCVVLTVKRAASHAAVR